MATPLLVACPLQANSDRDASSCTKAEFCQLIQKFKQDAVEQIVNRFPDVFTGKNGPLPLNFGLDNAKIHDDAAIVAELSGVKFQRYKLPVPCCDFQKVIEHVFGSMTRVFQDKLQQAPDDIEIDEYKTICRDAFLQCSKTESIKRDAASLPGTLRAIIKAKGGWPPKAFR